ncbi:MAG: succinyl-diaminopimelate desuccinylase [Xanthomonadales bacterium]|nr:succinyl-diaminopimelate desuccinylase [Xanthomonadales bacterium]
MSEVLQLASALIARPSITPDDAGCQRLIADRLQQAGFAVEWLYCEDVSNLLVTRGEGSPSLWFLGHTDVVPPGPLEDWHSPPFDPQARDGRLYGRGAADMKGAVAAMVTALERFAEMYPDHSGQAGLLLTSDEEGLAEHGIRTVAEVLKKRGRAPDYCLVGEPSSQEKFGDTIRIGRRGSIHACLVVDGIQGHTAFPHAIDNPVHRIGPFLAALTEQAWDEGDEDYPPSHCQVASIKAGSGAENVTPGHLELKFNFRNAPQSPSDDLRKRVEALLEEHGVENYRLRWRVSGEPFRSEPGALRQALVDTVQHQLDANPELNTGGGTSDGRFIAPLGTEVVEFGLLNQTIHQVNENTPIEDLARLEAIYQAVLERLLVT